MLGLVEGISCSSQREEIVDGDETIDEIGADEFQCDQALTLVLQVVRIVHLTGGADLSLMLVAEPKSMVESFTLE